MLTTNRINEMNVLLGRPRYMVRYWPDDPGVGQVRSVETLAGNPPHVTHSEILGTIISFREQVTGDVHLMSREMVKEVIIQQSDRYGYWHQIGVWTEEASS